MKRQIPMSLQDQEALILRKKREIEAKKIAEAQTPQLTSSIKTEPGSSTARNPLYGSKMTSSMFRHRALLRSGLLMKNKTDSNNAVKIKSSSVFEDEDYTAAISEINKTLKKETGSSAISNSSTEVKSKPVTDSKPCPPADSLSTSSSGGDESWFLEALKRAKEKARLASASSDRSSGSRGPDVKRCRWDTPAGDAPLQPSHSPAPMKAGGVLSMSVPSSIMKMVKEGEHFDAIKGVMLTRLTRDSPAIVAYANQVFGSTQYLTEAQWKQCLDQIKMNVVFQLLQAKQVSSERLAAQGKVQYEYDSDEEIDDNGTWEHKRRLNEMVKTQRKAEELTEKGTGKHHIGDFLPPEELRKFMEKFTAIQDGRDPDFSDYRNNKLTSDNIGYRMLKSMGWTEGQGLGPKGRGITTPVNQNGSTASHGLGIAVPDALSEEDNEYDAYRKRMMMSYRFRPNPLNNPRRAYY